MAQLELLSFKNITCDPSTVEILLRNTHEMCQLKHAIWKNYGTSHIVIVSNCHP